MHGLKIASHLRELTEEAPHNYLVAPKEKKNNEKEGQVQLVSS